MNTSSLPPPVPSPVPRRATPDDLPSIAKLHRLAFFHAMPHMPALHTPGEDFDFHSTAVFPGNEVWITESLGMVTGFIAFHSGWVDHLYIHPAHQRHGLGSALLAVAHASEPVLRLWTFQCNAGARRFYERHGFQIERQTDGAANEENQPDILYAWRKTAETPEPDPA